MTSDYIRVLVVDDSASARSMIARALETEPTIRVVGTAASGFTAIDAVNTLSPDAVTLDVEMPGMDGIEFLKRIRMTHPRLPVIMFSHLTQRGAVTTLDAMFHGATDFVGKPTQTGSPDAAREQVKAQLVPRILRLKTSRSGTNRIATSRARKQPAQIAGIVAIGSSTGGPVALDEIVCSLPRDFALPVVVVQDMPPMFTKLLAERMSSRARVPVVEAHDGDLVAPGKVLLAPGHREMALRREGTSIVAAIATDQPENANLLAIDVLFRSAARLYGSKAMGVVLTGMGHDALEGSRAIVDAGGHVLVQDEQSSVCWGMPGGVAKAGLAHAVLPVKDIAVEIEARGRHGASVRHAEPREIRHARG